MLWHSRDSLKKFEEIASLLHSYYQMNLLCDEAGQQILSLASWNHTIEAHYHQMRFALSTVSI